MHFMELALYFIFEQQLRQNSFSLDKLPLSVTEINLAWHVMFTIDWPKASCKEVSETKKLGIIAFKNIQ